MAKLALGKGLKALIPDETIEVISKKEHRLPGGRGYQFRDTRTGEVGMIGMIPVSKISPNPFQPRMDFDRDALEELKASIKEKGVIQPITVRLKGDGYELISGERRLRASIEAGITEIPAYVIDVKSDQEMLELALIENIQREKLNPIEIAHGYRRLIEECNLTQEQVAQKVSKDRTTITNFLRLLKLPKPIQKSLRDGEITMGHARALISLEDPETQMEIWELTLSKGLSVRKVEALVSRATRAKKKAKQKEKSSKETHDVNVAEVEATLRNRLATRVKIVHTSKGSGEIIIEYYSPDDLERIVDAIGNSEV
ncbi:MAG: ParB/RepB/Spo0J family partition protein [Chloroherpetonaceae bacterium]|nr:ParB/RepB/Spo0J family partition protein [Chloroherpetonaceae bacterium]MCS7210749.1 ParB/RepB/Spo0J family partition protein [Chloroherpetonaceae bacterium]MDW8019642.1 ParB/RepB/Spo0J family partition protein [Chloroherpetonaceae bacterium]